MTRLLSFAAAAAVLALPMAAAAQAPDPVLSEFQKICWASGGDYVKMLGDATADSWVETQVVPESDAGVSITDQAARTKAVNGLDLTLLVTRGLRHTKGGDVKVSTCKLAVNKPDADLLGASQAWVGSAPDNGDATSAVYFVGMGGAKPDHVGQAGVQAAMNAGGFGVLKFQNDDADSILVYQLYAK
ncbi:MAG TPA: hypothetical protein VMU37_01240 [Caulobacteraceae bacterium]|nr:hypothetical protein [Caulobacteraceae bacterium]